MSPTISKVEEKLLEGVTSSALYFVVGVIFLILGYLVVLLFNKKYNLNEEIGKGNASAGIMIFGIFVGLAMIISGVIM
jgi:putative membrane protein